MVAAWRKLFAMVGIACALGIVACGQNASAQQQTYPRPPAGLTDLTPVSDQNSTLNWPATDPAADPNGPSLDMLITKSMLYAAGIKFHVNPYLVMGLAWHESGWQPAVVSSAGAVGIMQVMPATAAVDGPKLLNRAVNLYDPGDNIEMGTAILKRNLDSYGNDLAKALTAYYAGGGAVTDWAHLRADCRRYVYAVYNAAMMFLEGKGPV